MGAETAASSSTYRLGGICGILSAVGLVIESGLWMLSGWTPESFSSAANAMAYLRSGGGLLTAAAAAGFCNLLLLVVLNIAIARRLETVAPILASAFLWFGMLGIALHLLVPLSHRYGTSLFMAWETPTPTSLDGAWTAFYLVGHEAAGGGGKLLMGASMIAAGAALLKTGGSRYLATASLLAGLASMFTLFTPIGPLSKLAAGLFMPSLALSVLFRGWWGMKLLRGSAGA